MKMAKMALRQIQVIKQELAVAELPAKLPFLKTTTMTSNKTQEAITS